MQKNRLEMNPVDVWFKTKRRTLYFAAAACIAAVAIVGVCGRPLFAAHGAGSESRRAGEVSISGRVVMPGNGSTPAKLAAVWLEGERAEPAPPLAHAVIDQRDKAFKPHVLMITRGTTVTFPNNDTVFHNVFAYFEARKFDLGMYPRGASRKQTFDKNGIVALLCNVHPQMSAYIVVVDTPYYRVADSDGHFQIDGVPPGAYTVHVWHESGAVLTQKITVPAQAGEPLTLTLKR